MSRRKRSGMKRKIAHANRRLDFVLEAIKTIHEEFEFVHPEHAEILANCARMIFFTQEGLRMFWKASWGRCPDNISLYGAQRKKRE